MPSSFHSRAELQKFSLRMCTIHLSHGMSKSGRFHVPILTLMSLKAEKMKTMSTISAGR